MTVSAEKDITLKDIALRVAEALPRDVGRGIARLDPALIKELDCQVGDIIEIKGKKKTAAKLLPSFPEHRGKSIIQVDGLIRENAGASLDEKVMIRKAASRPASAIFIKPLTPSSSLGKGKDSRYIGKLLEGLPVTTGDRIRATLFGSRYQDFLCIETRPGNETVIIEPGSSIKVAAGEGQKSETRREGISYEDIGGLRREVQRIREMIELPLKYPEIFERLGIEPPKGVLLHGLPGGGKTLIARAVANETEASFYHVNGPEVIHKFYGESEAKLRKIFEEAKKNAPSIIFLDEIDAIAAKREKVQGEVEKRVVAQLLALMDGLEGRGKVIVIGATNIPNALDPALRRPGRFDREICISVPDLKGRLEILQIHTRGMPLAEDVNLERLAEITHGFVGADLEALARESAMICLRKIMPRINFEQNLIPYEELLNLEVTMDNFLDALKEVEPSALREVFVEVPQATWSDVGGLDEIKRALRESVEFPLKYQKLFEYSGVKPIRGILLSGAPGTGKTLAARAAAHESQVNFVSIKGPELISKWVGESEKGIREVFRKAKQAAPCIIFFDELDSIAPARGGGGDSHVLERVVSQFLTEMDGIEELKGVVVLGATNRKELIDPALLRAGRFDLILELPLPDEKTRFEIFQIHTAKMPLAEKVDLKALAKDSAGLSGADITSVCQSAGYRALRSFIEREAEAPIKDFRIESKYFEEALKIEMGKK